MCRLNTHFHGLGLLSGLKTRLAEDFTGKISVEVPLHLCFQRRGLGFRSAIALKQSSQSSKSPRSLARQYLDNLAALPMLASEKSWCYEAIATDQGWLEFWLIPADIGCWLEILTVQSSNYLGQCQAIAEPVAPFSFQYLQHRCRTVAALAASTTQYSPQWCFAESPLSVWEQNLLEAIADFGVTLGQQQFKHHLLLKVEQAFWEFDRHCPLFYYLREEPQLGQHYLSWFNLLQHLFAACLGEIYGVPVAVW